MAAQVLEISRRDHPNRNQIAGAPMRAVAGRQARLYSFPTRVPLVQPEPNVEPASIAPPASRFRLHLATEIAIGSMLWLLWFLWNHAR